METIVSKDYTDKVYVIKEGDLYLVGDNRDLLNGRIIFDHASIEDIFSDWQTEICLFTNVKEAEGAVSKIRELSKNYERKLEILEVEIVRREYANVKKV